MKKTICLSLFIISILLPQEREGAIPIYEYYSKKAKTYAYSPTGIIVGSLYDDQVTDSNYKWKSPGL